MGETYARGTAWRTRQMRVVQIRMGTVMLSRRPPRRWIVHSCMEVTGVQANQASRAAAIRMIRIVSTLANLQCERVLASAFHLLTWLLAPSSCQALHAPCSSLVLNQFAISLSILVQPMPQVQVVARHLLAGRTQTANRVRGGWGVNALDCCCVRPARCNPKCSTQPACKISPPPRASG